MKKSALTILAILAITGVALGDPVLSVVEDTANPAATTGLTAYLVQATGIGINTLSEFNVVTAVNQVFEGDMFFPPSAPSEWLGDTTAAGADDSYVVFGDERFPDLGVVGATYYTDEGFDSVTLPATGDYNGSGILTNSDAGLYDAYVEQGLPSTTETTVDLLRLVVDNSVVTSANDISLTLTVATLTNYTTDVDINGAPIAVDGTVDVYDLEWPGVQDPNWLEGDANKDGTVSAADFQVLGQNYGMTSGATWEMGDFTGEGAVSAADFQLLGQNYGVTYDPYAAAAAAPEPGTVVMLILGALCLVGYRTRK